MTNEGRFVGITKNAHNFLTDQFVKKPYALRPAKDDNIRHGLPGNSGDSTRYVVVNRRNDIHVGFRS